MVKLDYKDSLGYKIKGNPQNVLNIADFFYLLVKESKLVSKYKASYRVYIQN